MSDLRSNNVPSAEKIMQLQKMYGNRAVSQMLNQSLSKHMEDRTSAATSTAPIQRVQTINDYTSIGRYITTEKAFKQYITYLINVTEGLKRDSIEVPSLNKKIDNIGKQWIRLRNGYDHKFTGGHGKLTLDEVQDIRGTIDELLPVLNEMEEEVEIIKSPTPTVPENERSTIMLYRKMVKAEADMILKGGSFSKANLITAMNYNRGDGHKKYFTTTLDHSKEFQNANSADADNEVVLEFELDWTLYWAFVKQFGFPNQMAGAFDRKDTATMNQEIIVKGKRANFRDPKQVTQAHDNKEHHNIGIGHDNVGKFADAVKSGRKM